MQEDIQKASTNGSVQNQTAENSLVNTPLSGHEPAMKIEDTDNLKPLFKHIQATWEKLGEEEPHWSVLTADRFKSEEFHKHKDAFYITGKFDLEKIFKTLERNEIESNTLRTCLEYGCGVGRVTYWLSKRFEKVIGCDISRYHIKLSQEYLREKERSNVECIHIANPATIRNLPKVDLVYSTIVLQHNPPPLIRMIIRELLKALNPGGVAFFQVLTYWTGYSFELDSYLKQTEASKEMEMHVLSQKRIFAIIRNQGCHVIEVMDDKYPGLTQQLRSNTFVVQRPNPNQA